MASPAENVFNQAEFQLKKQNNFEELIEKSDQLFNTPQESFKAIPLGGQIILDNYAASDDTEMTVVVRHEEERAGADYKHGEVLMISGRLQKGRSEATIPMYKVKITQPRTDGGSLQHHLAILVADPEQATGYHPLALVEQSILNRNTENVQVRGSARVGYDIFDAHSQLTELDMQELREKGLYIDPRSTEMLQEVGDILNKAVEASRDK